ncbi:MAG: MMPL family transporter [Gammaproteobacteria bacterium]|nr:MMPL family transporter [Gammaproteobacteria bacterium]
MNRSFNWVLEHPKLVSLISLAIFCLGTLGFTSFTFTTDYRYFFSEQNPQLKVFDDFQRRYGKSDNVFVVIKPGTKTVFNKPALHLVERFTEEAWKTPYSTRVDSLSNFQYISVEGDEIFVESLFEDALNLSDEALSKKRKFALAEPALEGYLISDDASHTALNITVQVPDDDNGSAQFEAVDYVDEIIDKLKVEFPEATFFTTGQLKINRGFMEAAMLDASTLIPGMFILLILFLWAFLRSFSAMFGTMIVVLISSVLGVGFGLALGIPMSSVASSSPLIILTLAVADSVHLLISYFHELKLGKPQKKAMETALEINLQPIFLTSLTTVIGFLSLNFNESPPIRDMGNMVAIGVVAAFVFSIWFLPSFMMFFSHISDDANEGRPHWAEVLSEWVNKYVNAFGIAVLVSTGFLAWAASTNELNDMLFEFLAEKLEARQEINYVNENMTGVMSLNYTVFSRGENGIIEPEYLKKLDEFKSWLEQQPEIKHVNAFSDVVKQINRMLNYDDPAYYQIPDSKEMVGQNLLLFEFSLPFGMDLNNQIDYNKSTSNLRIQLDTLKSKQLINLTRRIDDWVEHNTPEWFSASVTGPDYMFAKITFRTISSMTTGMVLAIALISLCLVVALKSVRLGLLSIIPNIVPLIVTFGIWGMVVGEVGLIASSVSVIGLGLMIDDTVHFLSKYQRAKGHLGYGFEQSVDYAFSRVASAILVTSIILMTGFATLGFSSFKPNMEMGILTSMTIGAALLVTFFLLPALLNWFDSKSSQGASSEEPLQ